MVGALLGDEHPHGGSCGRRVDAVQLHAARALVLVVLDETHRLRGPLDERARGHHLVDVEAARPGEAARGEPGVARLTAQAAEGAVGDARHRRQDDRRVDDMPTDAKGR